MPDNRKFRGRSQINLGGLFGSIFPQNTSDVSPIAPGDVDFNDATFDARTQTRFAPNNRASADYASKLNAEGILKAQQDANNFSDEQKLLLLKQQNAKDMLQFQQKLAEEQRLKDMSELGSSLVRISDTPGELDPDVVNVARDYNTKYGNTALSRPFTQNVYDSELHKGKIPEAEMRGRTDELAAIAKNQATSYSAMPEAIQGIKGKDLSNALTSTVIESNKIKNANDAKNPFVQLGQINYDLRDGTMQMYQPPVTDPLTGESTSSKMNWYNPKIGDNIVRRPSPSQNKDNNKQVITPTALQNSTKVTNNVEEQQQQQPSPEEVLKSIEEDKAMIKELAGSIDINDKIKIQKLKDRIVTNQNLIEQLTKSGQAQGGIWRIYSPFTK